MTKDLTVIHTKDKEGNPNGWVLPIAHTDDGDKIPQVYMTTLLPGCSKGPHLHKKRMGRFVCVHGEVLIVTRKDGEYHMESCGPLSGYKVIPVDPGIPCVIYNIGDGVAKVLAMPIPPWHAYDNDELTVDDWTYTL
jgi:hypothetical protein